jgi:hypothetical protein
MRHHMKLTAVSLGLAVFLGACAPLAPLKFKEKDPRTPALAAQNAQIQSGWDEPPVITEGVSSMVLITPTSIPPSVRSRKVELELEPNATVGDLVAVLGRIGVTTIISDKDVAARSFFLPRYKGSLGGLLSAVTRATNTWFVWHDGTLVVSGTEKISVSVPQEADFAAELTKGLTGLGVTTSSVSWQAGMASMDLTPRQFTKVRTYLERFTSNAAVVTIQMAVVNVTLKQDVKQGIDWDKLSLSATAKGTRTALSAWAQGSAPAAQAPAPAATGATPDVSSVLAGQLAGGVLSAALFSNRFSFEGLFGFLETYGTAETKQNVMLKTVTGSKVEFKSLTQIPYVSEVSVTTAGTGTSSNNLGSSQTAKADDGITVEMTPTYDAAANSVTIDFSLSIKAVLAFNELSAGNQVGTLSQPTTAERSFTDKLRVRPGQTVVVGGLTYDSVSDNRGAPLYLQKSKFESQSLKVDRQTTFIVLRPTVMRLGQVLASESGQSLDLLPQAEEPADEEPAVKAKAKGSKK